MLRWTPVKHLTGIRAISGYRTKKDVTWVPIGEDKSGIVVQSTKNPENLDVEMTKRESKISDISKIIFRRRVKFLGSFCNIAYLPEGNLAVPEVLLLGEIKMHKFDGDRGDSRFCVQNARTRPSSTAHILRMLFHRGQSAKAFNFNHPWKAHNNATAAHGINTYLVDKCFYITVPPRVVGQYVWFRNALQECCLLYNYVRLHRNVRQLYYVLRVQGDGENSISPRDMDMLIFLSRDIGKQAQVKNNPLHDKSKQHSLLTIVLINADDRRVDPMDVATQLRLRGIEAPIIGLGMTTSEGVECLRNDMVQHCVSTIPSEMLSLQEFKRLSVSMFNDTQFHCLYELAYRSPKLLQQIPLDPRAVFLATQLRKNTALEKESVNWNSYFEEMQKTHPNLFLRALDNASTNGHHQALGSRSESASTEVSAEVEGTSTALTLRGINQSDYDSLIAKLSDTEYYSMISRVSELRNPFLLPWYILPRLSSMGRKEENLIHINGNPPVGSPNSHTDSRKTKSSRYKRKPKVIRVYDVRCPADPTNPYISPARHISHRVDFCFRLPCQSIVRPRQRRILSEYYFLKNENKVEKPNKYTLPYFPNLIPVSFRPVPAHDFIEFIKPRSTDHQSNSKPPKNEAESYHNADMEPLARPDLENQQRTDQDKIFDAAKSMHGYVDLEGRPVSWLYLAAAHAGYNIRDFQIKVLNPELSSHQHILEIAQTAEKLPAERVGKIDSRKLQCDEFKSSE